MIASHFAVSPAKRLPRRPHAMLTSLLVVLLAVAAQAADRSPSAKGGKNSDDHLAGPAIRASEQAFVAAFNRGDAKAVAALWTEEGSLVDDQGQISKGRKAIEAEYAAFFQANAGARIEVAIQSIETPTPDTAIEDGVARVISKEGAAPLASRYTAVHVRHEGKWLMASVRETAVELPSAYPQLRELQWLVGSWEAKNEGTTLHTTVRWIADRSFLERSYTVHENGVTSSSGTQIIGWDPQAGAIRSWSFDSTGGHGSGVWTATTRGWSIEAHGMLADGTPTASHDLLIRIPDENDVFGWRSTDRKVGDTDLPDTGEVSLERVAEKH
jgi:uncharacterized protein (TIGR02246 family)